MKLKINLLNILMINRIIFWIVSFVMIVGSAYLIWDGFFEVENNQIVCTQEAKLCPDGSYVGRTGPNCEFAKCASERSENAESTAIRNIVENFGKKMESVSLLSPQGVVISEINQSYGDLVSPKLLVQWINNPAKAPGRSASSPWPDRIEISDITKTATNQYRVRGNIIYITSVEKIKGGSSGSQKIDLLVEKNVSDKWLVSEVMLREFNSQDIWKIFVDPMQGIKFEYPQKLQATYIIANEWPPKIKLLSEAFSCSKNKDDSSSKIIQEIINGQFYCIKTQTEGTAGSVYTEYTYKNLKDDRLVLINFTLRYPQCGNYSEPYKSACEKERAEFNISNMANKISESVKFVEEISLNTGIKGTVLAGPICPVEKFLPTSTQPLECADKPHETSFVITTADQSRVIKQFNSDANGKFSVNIPAGEYYIRSAAATNILPYCSSNGTIKIFVNEYTETIINCDTGIR